MQWRMQDFVKGDAFFPKLIRRPKKHGFHFGEADDFGRKLKNFGIFFTFKNL